MPMRRPIHRYPIVILLAGAACGMVHAAELGEPQVASHIGQPLVADIELAMVDDPAQAVQARIADAEVYSGAGIAMPPVLGTLHLSVMRRDGRQFLHVTSVRPVDADHLHLYLDLADKGQHNVRLATLWLTPDPNPAPPVAVVPAPAPAPAPAAASAPAAVQPAHPPKETPVAPRPAPVATEAPAPVLREPHPAARPAVARPPALAAQPKHVPAEPAGAMPAALAHLHAATQPPACAQPAREAQACVALGVKNAELRAQLGRLEDKVKGLQASFGAAATPSPPANPVAKPAPAEAKAQEPVKPKPINSIKPLVPRKAKAPAPEEGQSWATVAGMAALGLALAAGIVVMLRRRGTGRTAAPEAAATAAAEPIAEPTLE